MQNPGLRTLLDLLRLIDKKGPINFYGISLLKARAYGLVSRYLKFCLAAGLIEVHSEQQGRGPYPSKYYVVSQKGKQLLEIFEEVFEEKRAPELRAAF